MATYEIKKEGNLIKVRVTIPKLPSRAKDARAAREAVTEEDVRKHLAENGAVKGGVSIISGKTLTNHSGAAASGEFIFSVGSTPVKEKIPSAPKNILTSESEPAIVENSVKTSNKRKRSKNDSPSKRTTETSE